MFGTLGGPEILLLLVLALIVFGPRKLPEIGKSMGRMLAEFRRASNDFRRTIEDEVEAEKVRAALAEEPPSPPVSPLPSGAESDPVAAAAPPEAAGTAGTEPSPAAAAPPDGSVSRE